MRVFLPGTFLDILHGIFVTILRWNQSGEIWLERGWQARQASVWEVLLGIALGILLGIFVRMCLESIYLDNIFAWNLSENVGPESVWGCCLESVWGCCVECVRACCLEAVCVFLPGVCLETLSVIFPAILSGVCIGISPGMWL